MEIIKIDKQPSVAEHIEAMHPSKKCSKTKRFHLQHIKAVREAAQRKMKIQKPHLKYTTLVDAIGGYIEVVVSFRKKGDKDDQVQDN